MEVQIAVVVLFIFAGSLTRATFGFGEALVAMPLLTLVVDVRVAAALVAMTSIFNAAVILSTHWQRVEWSGAWPLVMSALVGIPLGVYALKHVPENAVKLVLALVVLSFASYNLLRPQLWRVKSDSLGFVFGLMAGILGGAYNTLGPPLVIFATLRGWDAQKFRSTLQAVFLPSSLFVGLNHFLQGLWSVEVWNFSGQEGPLSVATALAYCMPFCLPAMVLASVIGHQLNSRFNGPRFSRYVFCLLLVLGAMLVVSVVTGSAAAAASW